MLRTIISKLFGEKPKLRKRKLDDPDKSRDDDNRRSGVSGISDPGVNSTEDVPSTSSTAVIIQRSPKTDAGLLDQDEGPEDAFRDTSSLRDQSSKAGPSGMTKIDASTSSAPTSSASYDDHLQAGCSGMCGSRSGGVNVEGSIPSMASSFPALPPPKRKKASRVIEVAEDWCETDANWKDIQYTWTINSFSKCQEELGNYVTSPEFPSALITAANNNHSMVSVLT